MLTVFDTKAAARLLGQASFGTTSAEVRRTQTLGAAGWVDEQLAMPCGQGHVDGLFGQGLASLELKTSSVGAHYSSWRAFLSRPDQLRQRMVYALSQIFVVSLLDVLDTHAFGSFRSLLEAVTLSPAMGVFLSMRGSQRANAAGRQPDENYAREVMQLFTIGLHELAPNGSLNLRGGAPIETYDADDVSGSARVFTG